ncbi:MAG: Gfo/Idh/MocA family oxidoreductase [Nitrospinae bacterium]|nr:Gfo/Idh/MocA family oxidoreductase [Nitrospinota bacterium]
MRKYRVGLIGCGRIGTLLEEDPLRGKPCTHAGGFRAVKPAQIVAGCDINPERLSRFGRRWGAERLYSDHREMLLEEDLDIVCIATWTHLHARMVMDAANAGARGIFCEKPIASRLEDARAIVRLCEEKKIPLLINHERRWDSHYRKARDLILKGKIGEPRTLIGNALSWKPGQLPVAVHGGGPMFHDGTHLTDLLLYFGGPIDWVSGHESRPYGKKYIEETACAMVRFRNGALGFIEGGGARKYFNFELDIQGSEGRILIGNAGRALYLTRKSGRFTGFHELERVPFPETRRYETPFVGGARDMIRCIQSGEPSLSSGRDGLKALEVILAIYKSAAKMGRRLEIHDGY